MNSQRPRGAKRSTSARASSRMAGRSCSTERGVNARLTSLRRRVWSGPSMARSVRASDSYIGPSQTPWRRTKSSSELRRRVSASNASTLSRAMTRTPIGVRTSQLWRRSPSMAAAGSATNSGAKKSRNGASAMLLGVPARRSSALSCMAPCSPERVSTTPGIIICLDARFKQFRHRAVRNGGGAGPSPRLVPRAAWARVRHLVSAGMPSTIAPAGIRRGATYFPELEALRGLAIVLVFVFHADGSLVFPFVTRAGSWPSPALAYIQSGHTGVTLFFILSGFLLSLPFLEEAYGGRRVSRSRFYARRALRILPLYYAAVVVGTLITSRTAADLWRGVPYLFFVESKHGLTTPIPPFSDVWWSLATEVQFYAVLPLIALTFGWPLRRTLLLLAAYGGAYAAVASGWLVPRLEPWFRAQSLLGRGPLFLLGILAAWLWSRHGEALRGRLAATRWLAIGGADVLLFAVVAALGCLLQWATFRGFMALEVTPEHVWHLLEGVAWTAVLLMVLLLPLRARALVSNPVLARLGVLSYSIYVLHRPVLEYTLSLWRRLLPQTPLGWDALAGSWFVLTTALCLGLASLTYRLIERPFLVRKERLDAGAAPAEADALAAGAYRPSRT